MSNDLHDQDRLRRPPVPRHNEVRWRTSNLNAPNPGPGLFRSAYPLGMGVDLFSTVALAQNTPARRLGTITTSKLRPVYLTVGNQPVDEYPTWAYPDGDKVGTFLIPVYEMTVEGTDARGKRVHRIVQVLRFGVRSMDGKTAHV